MAIRSALENLVAVCRAGNVAIHGGDGDIKRFTKALEDAERVLESCKTVPCLTLPDDIEEPLATVPDATAAFGGFDER
jgi:hypothetical protein